MNLVLAVDVKGATVQSSPVQAGRKSVSSQRNVVGGRVIIIPLSITVFVAG